MVMDEKHMQNILSLLQDEFNHILGNSGDVCFSPQEAYRNAYTLVLHKYGDLLYTCLRETVTAHLKSKANSLLLVTQNDFLTTFNQIWNNHQTSMVWISDILLYMDRVYVRQNDVANVVDLGRQIFRDQIYRYSGIHEKLRDTLLNLIKQERNGEVVDNLAIKNSCQILNDLGFGNRSVYKTDFEKPFLQQTAEFYEIDIQNYSTENRASRFIIHIKTRMTDEYERVKNSLADEITAARVVAVFEQVLMKKFKDTLLDIAVPERNILVLNNPFVDKGEFELPYYKQSAELYEFGIRNLSTENVASKCLERVKSRLIQLYTRAKNCLNKCTETRRVATVEKELAGKLRDRIIKTIVAERNGEVMDCLATKNVLQILIIIGMDDSFLYNGVVEIPEDFYKKEIQNCLAENSALKCVEMLKPRKIAISKWTKYYLDENIEVETVFAGIEAELQKQMSTNVEMKISDITQNLKCRKSEELGCMYKQFSSCIQDSLISQSDVNEPQEDVEENHAITFIQNLLDLKQRVDHCSINLFKPDECSKRIFKAVHDIGFLQLMNGNQTIPEYLALFIDDKLKNIEISEQENEAILNETICLFKFLLEKDVFECYYRKHLAKRLLFNTVSDANEKYLISQLKVECGHQFTAKLEGMIQDMAISDTHMKEFREHQLGVSLDGVDLNVTVLTTRFWPIPSVTLFCVMPHAPMNAFESFKSFYLIKHHGRKLTLNHQLGSAELSATFLEPTQEGREDKVEVLPSTSTSDVSQLTSVPNNGPRKYRIVVSTYQMCILLMFNNRNELTYEEIKNETGMPDEDLVRASQSLAMGKASQRILIKHPQTKEIESSHVFSVNDKFSSKLHRIRIQTVKAKSESEPERKQIRQKVEEGRKYQIEAAIVRIMKARQKLSHIGLVVELKEQLKSRFLPKPTEVKKGIEVLIEREYLARTTDDRKVYTYLA